MLSYRWNWITDAFKTELASDPIVRNHLSTLYDKLLEQNILRIIEPYSRIELQHIASLVHQPVREIEQKYVDPPPSRAADTDAFFFQT